LQTHRKIQQLWTAVLSDRHSSTVFAVVFIAIGSWFAVNSSLNAAPIGRLDFKTASAAAALSLETLGANTSDQTGLVHLEQAVVSFRNGNYDAALKSLSSATTEDANLPPAPLMMARMFLAIGNGNQARLQLEQAAVNSPTNADIFLLFGEIAKAEGRLSDALLNFEKSKSLALANSSTGNGSTSNGDVRATLAIASVYELRGQWADADVRLRESIKAGADQAPVLIRLARVQFALQSYENAEKLLRRAYVQDPQIDPVEITLGQWFHVNGQKEQAERWVRLAIERKPSDPQVLTAAVLWAVETERLEEASGFVGQLSVLLPDDPNVIRMQGIVARFLSDYEMAENHFQRLLVDHPGDFLASNQLALVLLGQDQVEKQRRAVQVAELNYRQYPRSVDARVTLGWAYLRQNRSDDADKAFASIGASEAIEGDSAYYVARYHHDRGRSEVAQAILTGLVAGRGAFTQRRAASELLDALKAETPVN